MGESYKIVAPPDPASGRRKWLWLIALGVLALVATGVSFGPGLYRSTLLAREGPGNGPLLVKRADGKIELQVPPAQVLIGKPYLWRKLGSISDSHDGLTFVGDFDGDGDQELLVWFNSSPAVLFESDGASSEPGLQCSKLPMAKVFDWNGDGKDDLSVSAGDVPAKSWPQSKKPRKFNDLFSNVFLSVTGEIVGSSAKRIVWPHSITGSFTEVEQCQVLRSSFEQLFDEGSFTAEKSSEAQQHPEMLVFGSNGKEIAAINECKSSSADLMAVDLNGDRLDEVLALDEEGRIWQCKYGADPTLLEGWPDFTAPTSSGNVDGQPGEELIVVTTDPGLQGNWLAVYFGKEHPLSQRKKQLEAEIREAAIKRLTAVGIVQPDYSGVEDPNNSLEKQSEILEKEFDGYISQFAKSDNLWPFGEYGLIAWEHFRPEGFIYYPQQKRLQRLRFPRFLRWSNAWTSMWVDADDAVVCVHPDRQDAIIYITPTQGTGLLGFNAQGQCVYYQEFGTGVSSQGALHTQDGDYIVLRVGNELRIYP